MSIPIRTYEVAKMVIAPEAQGRGVGRLLMSAAIAWTRANGVRRLSLESNARLVPALRLCELAGFCHLLPCARPLTPALMCSWERG